MLKTSPCATDAVPLNLTRLHLVTPLAPPALSPLERHVCTNTIVRNQPSPSQRDCSVLAEQASIERGTRRSKLVHTGCVRLGCRDARFRSQGALWRDGARRARDAVEERAASGQPLSCDQLSRHGFGHHALYGTPSHGLAIVGDFSRMRARESGLTSVRGYSSPGTDGHSTSRRESQIACVP